jgi:hypothetical protein
MLLHRDHNDKAARDVLAGAEQYWLRFFATLKMTLGLKSRRAARPLLLWRD